MIRVRYFAAAAEASGTDVDQFEIETLPSATVGGLREAMVAAHGSDLDTVLTRCSMLIDGHRTDDPSTPLTESAAVDVLPPFAGG